MPRLRPATRNKTSQKALTRGTAIGPSQAANGARSWDRPASERRRSRWRAEDERDLPTSARRAVNLAAGPYLPRDAGWNDASHARPAGHRTTRGSHPRGCARRDSMQQTSWNAIGEFRIRHVSVNARPEGAREQITNVSQRRHPRRFVRNGALRRLPRIYALIRHTRLLGAESYRKTRRSQAPTPPKPATRTSFLDSIESGRAIASASIALT